ncbi:MAG: pilus assembly protein PilM [Planctomycetia bacterium]|nr:pilus assembly protein PilM [Planctomycetia bacterium]MBL6915751.1 pilus assembly protein PilM [Planctomycetota bacterium]HCW45448.1 hypothetical protein [Planctomycetota bacterium]
MADFDEVWCIDSGRTSLKAIKIQRSGNGAEIVAAEKIDHPQGSGPEVAGAAISALASQQNLTGPLAVALPSRSALTSFITVPPVDGKKLEELIGYEAQQNIPLPMEDVIWGSHVCGDTDDGEKEIGIFAVRSEEVSDLLEDLGQEDLDINLLTLGNVGLLNLIRFDLRPQRPMVALEIGAHHTDLVIVNGSRYWFRSVPIAGKDFTTALQERFGCSEEEAENLKVTAAKSEHAAKIYEVLQPLLRDLVNEINRSIGYYKSRAGEIKVEDLFLFGGSGKIVGLRKFLEENLRIRVQVFKSLQRVRIRPEANIVQQEIQSFSSCIGVGIQALGLGDVQLNLLPQEQQEAVEFKKKQKVVLGAVSGLYILIAFFMVIFGGKIDNAKAVLDEAAVVDQLKENEKKLESLQEDQRVGLEVKANTLLSRGQGRLASRQVLELIAAIPNASQVAESIRIEVEDGSEKDSTLGSVEADQESLNSKKTWLSGFDIRKVRVTETGSVLEKGAKVDSDLLFYDDRYQVVVKGFRYDQGDATSNDQQLKAQVVDPIEKKLIEAFGAPEFGERVSRQVGIETMLMLSEDENFKAGRQRGGSEDGSADHGTPLFPWSISWIYPPLPAADAGEE